MRSADVTFVILTKDEAQRIGDCLASLPAGAPALVYDAESSDATPDIARRLGARVVSQPWAGFVAARENAAALVQTPWTFMLDADERLTPQLRAELAALEPPERTVAYSVPRRNIFCGRWMRGAGWWPDRLIRLFRTGQATPVARGPQSGALLHETWRARGVWGELRSPLEHRSYDTPAHYRRKFAAYTDIEAGSGPASLRRTMAHWLLVPLRAAWLLGPKLGLRDGWRGAFIAFGSAAYPAVAATKAWRRRRRPTIRVQKSARG
jgi:glycosyltransferase involved in cell wall biosynthesis